jgi:hypothetical protein
MSFVLAGMVTIAVGLIFGSIFEWFVHKYVMHRRFLFISYPYLAHDQIHHKIFGPDKTYHLQGQPAGKAVEARNKIAAAYWMWAVVIPLGALPSIAAAAPFAYFGWWTMAYVIIGIGTSVATAYYATYETIHWWMHLPRQRKAEGWRAFILLNGHHVLHHRYTDKNLNVVLPLADWLFGTLLIRSPVKFAQARGPSVPDLQPLTA